MDIVWTVWLVCVSSCPSSAVKENTNLVGAALNGKFAIKNFKLFSDKVTKVFEGSRPQTDGSNDQRIEHSCVYISRDLYYMCNLVHAQLLFVLHALCLIWVEWLLSALQFAALLAAVWQVRLETKDVVENACEGRKHGRGRSRKTVDKSTKPTKVAISQQKGWLAALSCKCQNCCWGKVSAEERERLFANLYKLADHATQNMYLFRLLQREQVKCSAFSWRNTTISYHMRCQDSSRMQVCKKSFCEIHAIGKWRVEMLAGDSRGKHVCVCVCVCVCNIMYMYKHVGVEGGHWVGQKLL